MYVFRVQWVYVLKLGSKHVVSFSFAQQGVFA
ncbi:hypothetical protein EYZ11_012290 [Aspergillus tanneri]|uniref:Uncharacterized protein n=1 Tax=Aspergillus tanneri TaxID=1220188 RepID=A0A4S3J2Q1_9EURO|nr:hypothetical protein EYZ11_012290 [Aspergillus tanneri]